MAAVAVPNALAGSCEPILHTGLSYLALLQGDVFCLIATWYAVL